VKSTAVNTTSKGDIFNLSICFDPKGPSSGQYYNTYKRKCRSEWPRGLSRRSSAARLLRLWVRIPPGTWMCVCRECFVLSGRGLCDGLITRPEKSYRMWRVAVWSRNLENEEAKARYRASLMYVFICNVLQYSLLLSMLYTFRAVSPPIIRSSKLYTR
jgi:hypothetical protein